MPLVFVGSSSMTNVGIADDAIREAMTSLDRGEIEIYQKYRFCSKKKTHFLKSGLMFCYSVVMLVKLLNLFIWRTTMDRLSSFVLSYFFCNNTSTHTKFRHYNLLEIRPSWQLKQLSERFWFTRTSKNCSVWILVDLVFILVLMLSLMLYVNWHYAILLLFYVLGVFPSLSSDFLPCKWSILLSTMKSFFLLIFLISMTIFSPRYLIWAKNERIFLLKTLNG